MENKEKADAFCIGFSRKSVHFLKACAPNVHQAQNLAKFYTPKSAEKPPKLNVLAVFTGWGGNYGYKRRRQFDQCTHVTKFAPQGAKMHPGTNFCTLYR